MKNKKVWITVAVIAVIIIILVWGSKTNWWGMGKQTTTVTPTASTNRVTQALLSSGRWIKVDNLSTGACPEGATSGKNLGEGPIGYNNGNPIYNCYRSTSVSA